LLAVLAAGFSSFYEQRQKSDISHELGRIAERYRAESERRDKPGFPSYFAEFESDYYAKTALITIREGVVSTVLMGGGNPNLKIVLRSRNAEARFDDYEMILLPNPPMHSEMEGMMQAVREWIGDRDAFREVMERGRTIVYRSRETASSTTGTANLLIAVTPVTSDGYRSGEVLFAVSSLQPVTHAASVFRDLSVYVFGAAFVFVLLLAVGYARIVAHPLIRLNAIARRLANLDFSVRTRWMRKDEIGELARTFDFLADNLHRTLAELQTANEKLQKDIEKEKRLERMRREFIAGVSHELKTPLSLIGGYAEGLKDNIANEAKREKYADVILEETRRMAAIVGDMIDLSQLESGHYKLKRETFDAAELLNEAAGRAEALRSGKTVYVKVNPPQESGGRALVYADRFRINQVLTNLVTNAVRHTPDGGTMELAAIKREDDWELSVYNEGEPIPEEEIPRIWEQFYRIDKARSWNDGGTGIGLAIVRQILELHGSRYEVRNERGGVTFTFTLRAARD
jgi:signal transduction histidine kinase